MTQKTEAKLWGGRFSEPTDAFVESFTASVEFDQRFYLEDILGSKAHARMLTSVGVLTAAEEKIIIDGLVAVQQEIEAGKFEWSIAREDVHMNIEARLTELVGDVGKKLHTGRSRNDQVATDIRLWLRSRLVEIDALCERVQLALIDIAEREASSILPGFTHLQAAQPITFGHHMLAWHEMIKRDRSRFADCAKRLNTMPLGSAALAGTTYPIDRQHTASALGFTHISENSLDAVSDRDFAIEFCSAAALCMTHLSRWSEELVLWASAQFNFVDLPDRFCTGSSIMPQKKNPDVPELIRGKTGRVNGNLIALLTLMKSQPLAYNKDNQEDKEPIFDTVDTLQDCLRAYADMIPALQVNHQEARHSALSGFTTATDLADYLVCQGLPFRDAHEVVGKAVAFGLDCKRDLSELTLAELQSFHPSISDDVYEVLTLEGSIAARDHIGGTAPKQVLAAAARARNNLTAN